MGGIAVAMTTGNTATLLPADLIWGKKKDAMLQNSCKRHMMKELMQKSCLIKTPICVWPAGLIVLLLMHYTASLA